MMIDNQALCEELKAFAAERDWEQFHTPKNLAASISIEAAELLELFQWSRGQQWGELQDPKLKNRTAEELADILLYLIRFADLAGIDLEQAARQKMLANAAKYPAAEFKGSDRKYNE
ncbi:nucleotide pyrophosphohydrolase [Undibacterium terreum]|uniref:Nucleotide pyrophosphohydrolase n=1 Tax=Undibacterium terreum TaxID=1224302 RepID=A0A916U6A2_9BURK|nr:nucleotide pyrophosphohydrolase [Undibacterium terreum]GGC61457.1 nucleotide pyrophosphohydrolase [Undibacterium terreum]